MKDKKNIKGKEKKGELKFLLCRSLVMVPTCAQKTKKKKKGIQVPPLLRLGNGTVGTQRQHDKKKKKRRNANSSYVVTSQWRPFTPKTTKKRGGAQLKLHVYQYLVMVPNYA